MPQEVLGIVAKKVKINFQDIRRVGYAVPCPYVFFISHLALDGQSGQYHGDHLYFPRDFLVPVLDWVELGAQVN